MAQSLDHPELKYVQAAGYTVGRGGHDPIWIVVHDMEAGEDSGRAESTALYFANPGDGRNVSSHYCVDDDSVIQCVRLKDTAWTVGNTPGNQRGINWELAGFARQNREQWLDAFGLAMFNQMAPIVKADAEKYRIPLRKLTVAELRAYKPGVTSHNDLREAFNVTTHTDPGPSFPWDVFLDIMNGGGGMTPEQWEWLQNMGRTIRAMAEGKDSARQVKYNPVTGKYEDVAALSLLPYWSRVNQSGGGTPIPGTGGSISFTGTGTYTPDGV
jgi:N-acetyl-anhydromuramyl-L-alanine amidase AmpD